MPRQYPTKHRIYGGTYMRGVHSVVDDIRRGVFKEVAALAYEGGDYQRVDQIPFKLAAGEVGHHRHDIFLERAIVSARLRLALEVRN